VSEENLDPINTDIELYQTWYLAALAPLDGADDSIEGKRHLAARQGFSTTGAPDTGTSFAAKQQRIVNDPYALFEVNPYHFEANRASAFQLDFHHWENDAASAARQVRGAFTDQTLKYMDAAWKAANGDRDKAKKALVDWLNANGKTALEDGLRLAGLITSPWVKLATELAPVVPLILDYLKEQGDDYFGMHRFGIKILGGGTPQTSKWRVIPPSGEASGWITGEGRVETVQDIRDASGRNWLKARYVFRVVD
jgi:hypothetical protein